MSISDEPIGTERVLQDLARERKRTVVVEGFGRAGDDAQPAGRLAMAAASYLVNWNAFMTVVRDQNVLTSDEMAEALTNAIAPPGFWPLDPAWWKPHNDRSDLIRAGALIIAEVERLDRATGGLVLGSSERSSPPSSDGFPYG